MATTSSTRRSRDSAHRQILEAACRRIATAGIDGVRIAHIAADAGVSTALVHYHFATRDALLAEALEHSFDRTADTRTTGRPAEPATHAARVALMVEECLPADDDRRVDWALWVELWPRAMRHPALRPVAERLYARYHAWLAEGIEAGVAAGEFVGCDVAAVADRTLALIDGLSVRALAGDGAVTLERIRDEVGASLARDLGLAAPVRVQVD